MQPAKRKRHRRRSSGRRSSTSPPRALAGQKERAEGMMDAVDFFETKLLGNGIVDVGTSIEKSKVFVDDAEKALKQPYRGAVKSTLLYDASGRHIAVRRPIDFARPVEVELAIPEEWSENATDNIAGTLVGFPVWSGDGMSLIRRP